MLEFVTTAKVYMGLQATGILPTCNVCVANALHYALLSTELWKYIYPERDMMKDLYRCYPLIKDILKLVNIETDKYDERIKVISIASKLLWKLKNEPRDKIKKDIYKRFAKTISYQDECFILDAVEKPFDFETKVLYTLFRKLSPNQRIGSVILDHKFLEEPDDIGNNFSPETNSTTPNDIELCPNTLRPYTIINNKEWTHYAVQKWGRKYISLNKYILEFYLEYKHWPKTDEDFILFYKLLEKVYKILPDNIDISCKDVANNIFIAIEKRDSKDVQSICKDIELGKNKESRMILERYTI
jgi:hypothetical protein